MSVEQEKRNKKLEELRAEGSRDASSKTNLGEMENQMFEELLGPLNLSIKQVR
jgi:hypothetical protein